jgi:hypothetical protein
VSPAPRLAGALVAAGAVYLGFAALAHVWHPDPRLGYLAASLAVTAAVLGAGVTAPALAGRRAAWIALPVAALVGVALVARPPYGAMLGAPVALALLAAGALVGACVGRRVQHPGHLLVVAYVSSVADLYSVLTPSGPSAQVASSERAMHLLAVTWPIPGMERIAPVLGIADVVMVALYLAACRQHGLPLRRTAVALGIGFVAAFGLVVATARPVPALPFLGIAMVAAHAEARRLPPGDRRVALAGMGLFTLLALLVALADLGWLGAVGSN